MKNHQSPFKFYAAILSLLLLISSCAKEDESPEVELRAIESVEGQLERLTQKMQRYYNFKVAEAQKFVQVSPYVPNMGIHYGRLDRFDGKFELEKPEILLYLPDENGTMTFVGVEYAVPVDFSPEPPEGFLGDEDHWHYNPHVAPDLGGSWTLHAWVIMDNPDGVFSASNPDVPATDPSVN